MSSSDYLSAKKKLVLYNSISTRSVNNTNISHSTSASLSEDNNRYYSTREELSGSNQVTRYEDCATTVNEGIFENSQICNVKIENDDDTVYALQTY